MQTTSPAELIASITEWRTCNPDPLHDVTDPRKVADLAADMETRGWVGPPIVVLSEVQAITGSHRLRAAIDAGLDTIPQVTIEDLCTTFGIDWEAHRADRDDWYTAAAELRDLLPAEIVAYLGYDVDGER